MGEGVRAKAVSAWTRTCRGEEKRVQNAAEKESVLEFEGSKRRNDTKTVKKSERVREREVKSARC